MTLAASALALTTWPPVRATAHHAILLDEDLGDLGVGLDLGAIFGGGFRHGLGNGAHAANGVAPGALLAVHLAEGVVQQDIGRAGIVGARVVPDDRIEAEQGFDRLALEPVGQEVCRRSREEVEEEAPLLEIETAQSVAERRRMRKLAEPPPAEAFDHVRRRFQGEVAQNIGDGLELGAIPVIALGVGGGELRDLGLGASFAGQQIAAVRQRQEVHGRPLDDAESVPVQVEIGDDLGVEQADRVGGDGVAEAGVELFGDRRAADHGPPFEHLHLQARAGEIGGADETVMAAADDHDVEWLGGSIFRGGWHSAART